MSNSTTPTDEERRLTDADDNDADSNKRTAGEVIGDLEKAEAEAAEAEALAVAAQARARAARLRAKRTPSTEMVVIIDATDDAEGLPASPAVDDVRRRPRIRTLGTAVALLCSVAMLAVSGYMVWTHHDATQEQRIRAEYAAAAKQAVVTLMSIDFKDPRADVQRIIDNSADPFRAEFEGAAEDFIKVATDAKVTTKATANVAAVQSTTSDSAVVLVSASSTVTNDAGAQEAPRNWRLTVDLKREGDQIKMSKVEFVP